jgi:TPR repeat protein
VLRRGDQGSAHLAAIATLRALAQEGDTQALRALTEFTVTNAKTISDLAPLRGFIQKLARLGYGNAQYLEALMAIAGVGDAPDPVTGMKILEKAALSELAVAQRYLGLAYLSGTHVSRDDAMAAQWLTEAAKNNDGPAAFNLALMKARGRGGPQDMDAARALARKAASKGIEKATSWLAANPSPGPLGAATMPTEP